VWAFSAFPDLGKAQKAFVPGHVLTGTAIGFGLIGGAPGSGNTPCIANNIPTGGSKADAVRH